VAVGDDAKNSNLFGSAAKVFGPIGINDLSVRGKVLGIATDGLEPAAIINPRDTYRLDAKGGDIGSNSTALVTLVYTPPTSLPLGVSSEQAGADILKSVLQNGTGVSLELVVKITSELRDKPSQNPLLSCLAPVSGQNAGAGGSSQYFLLEGRNVQLYDSEHKFVRSLLCPGEPKGLARLPDGRLFFRCPICYNPDIVH
jgi:hypothetical protein